MTADPDDRAAADPGDGADVVPPVPLPTIEPAVSLLERLDRTNPALTLVQQLQLAQDRVQWLGARLAEQVACEGVGGNVGDQMAVDGDGAAVKLSEYARQLAEQEFRERQHVASLAERIAKLGFDVAANDRDLGRWLAEALKALVPELGMSLDDEPTLEAAKRVAIQISERRDAARRTAGAVGSGGAGRW